MTTACVTWIEGSGDRKLLSPLNLDNVSNVCIACLFVHLLFVSPFVSVCLSHRLSLSVFVCVYVAMRGCIYAFVRACVSMFGDRTQLF